MLQKLSINPPSNSISANWRYKFRCVSMAFVLPLVPQLRQVENRHLYFAGDIEIRVQEEFGLTNFLGMYILYLKYCICLDSLHLNIRNKP